MDLSQGHWNSRRMNDYPAHTFPVKVCHSLLMLWTLENMPVLSLGGIWKQLNNNRKSKNTKNMTLGEPGTMRES